MGGYFLRALADNADYFAVDVFVVPGNDFGKGQFKVIKNADFKVLICIFCFRDQVQKVLYICSGLDDKGCKFL